MSSWRATTSSQSIQRVTNCVTQFNSYKINIFEHYRLQLMAHSKKFSNIWMMKSISKSCFFEEQFLLTFVKDMQHFFDHHSFHISFSCGKFCSIYIAKSTLTEPLFNLESVTIKYFYVGDTLSGRCCLF